MKKLEYNFNLECNTCQTCEKNNNECKCEKEDIHNFSDHTCDNCKELFNEQIETIGRVVDVYDGDTCTIIFKFRNVYTKFKVRLNGIDTPEISTKEEEQKKNANLAKHKLLELVTNIDSKTFENKSKKEIKNLLNSYVYLINLTIYKTDKYGRLLGDLYSYPIKNNISFSQILINENLAFIYNGGTKNLTL